MAKNDTFGDDRLKKETATAARGSRNDADVDRVQEDGLALSPAERRAQLRQYGVQEVLPKPPAIPGYHMCWLSTTNSADPVHKRMQMGYLPVTANEVPGFDQYKIDGGQFDGCIQCQEMLLFKIEDSVYQDLMAIYHHDIPLEQEQSIVENLNARNEVDSEGRLLGQVEGDFNRLGRSPGPTPKFH